LSRTHPGSRWKCLLDPLLKSAIHAFPYLAPSLQTPSASSKNSNSLFKTVICS
jgi:hypothetical protein